MPTASEAKKQRRCFVIGPIGEEGSEERRFVEALTEMIRELLADQGFTVQAAHQMSDPGLVTGQIVERLVEDDLVIAVVTGLNPNVMYELAIRHCDGKPAVMIAQNGMRLPFDIGNQRTIFYDDSTAGAYALKSALRGAITAALDADTPDNVVFAELQRRAITDLAIEDDVQTIMLDLLQRIQEDVARPGTAASPVYRVQFRFVGPSDGARALLGALTKLGIKTAMVSGGKESSKSDFTVYLTREPDGTCARGYAKLAEEYGGLSIAMWKAELL